MSYTPTSWESGDIVTAEKLNHIEEGIEGSADGSIYQADKIVMKAYPNDGTPGENSIVLPLTTSGHNTNANGSSSIHIGPGTSTNRSSNLHMGAVGTPSANVKGRFPWIVDELEADGRLVTYTDGLGCINVGNNKIKTGGNSAGVAMGSGNISTAGSVYEFGGYNLGKHTYTYALGYGLKGNEDIGTVMVGYCGDAESDDRFIVANGTVSNSTRTPSTAFQVKDDGTAIAQTALGIKKSDGTVVSITAAQLEALLALLN